MSLKDWRANPPSLLSIKKPSGLAVENLTGILLIVEAAFYIFLIYIYIPLVWGILARNKLDNNYHKGGVIFYNLVRFKHSSYEEKYLILLTFLLILAIPAATHIILVKPKSETFATIGRTITILAMILAATYAITSKEVLATYQKYSGRLNFVIAVSATVNLSRATSYAEGIITGLVGIRASELPTGLAWLTLIMVPVAWLVTLAIGSLAIYFVALFKTSHTDASKIASQTTLQLPVKRKVFRELAPGYAIAFSFAILAISPLTVAEGLLRTSWADNRIREELVDASFHVKAEKCGIDGIKGAKIAYLESGKAIVALPDTEHSYVFEAIDCPETWLKPEEIVKRHGNAPDKIENDPASH